MASSLPPTLRRRLGVLVAGVVVATVLTAVAAAAAPTPMGAPAGVPVPGSYLAVSPRRRQRGAQA